MMAFYSVASAVFVAVYIHNTIYTPFVVPMSAKWEIIKGTIFEYYMYTPVHATLYFMGVSTLFLVRKYKEVKICSWHKSLLQAYSAVGVEFNRIKWRHSDMASFVHVIIIEVCIPRT